MKGNRGRLRYSKRKPTKYSRRKSEVIEENRRERKKEKKMESIAPTTSFSIINTCTAIALVSLRNYFLLIQKI